MLQPTSTSLQLGDKDVVWHRNKGLAQVQVQDTGTSSLIHQFWGEYQLIKAAAKLRWARPWEWDMELQSCGKQSIPNLVTHQAVPGKSSQPENCPNVMGKGCPKPSAMDHP